MELPAESCFEMSRCSLIEHHIIKGERSPNNFSLVVFSPLTNLSAGPGTPGEILSMLFSCVFVLFLIK